jgi:predicted patatin/cPLA2 family phospholipase
MSLPLRIGLKKRGMSMGWKPLLIFLIVSENAQGNSLSISSKKKLQSQTCQKLDAEILNLEKNYQMTKKKILSLKGESQVINPLKRPKHRSQIEILESEVMELENKLKSLNGHYNKNCS